MGHQHDLLVAKDCFATLFFLDDSVGKGLSPASTAWIQLMRFPTSHLAYYIDYERMGRDMEMSGDIFTVETGYEQVHIF